MIGATGEPPVKHAARTTDDGDHPLGGAKPCANLAEPPAKKVVLGDEPPAKITAMPAKEASEGDATLARPTKVPAKKDAGSLFDEGEPLTKPAAAAAEREPASLPATAQRRPKKPTRRPAGLPPAD
jgi:hypothetical protein